MTSKISDPNLLMKAKEAFTTLFKSPDPFDEPFQPNTSIRKILYPTEYELSEEQYAAIASAAIALGESTAFISETEGHKKGLGFEDWGHWRIDLRDYPYPAMRNLEWCSLMEVQFIQSTLPGGSLFPTNSMPLLAGRSTFLKCCGPIFQIWKTKPKNFSRFGNIIVIV